MITGERTVRLALMGQWNVFSNRRALMAGLVAVMGLGACSSFPDAINPVEWYRTTVGDPDRSESGDENGETAKNDGGFPNLASVPERPVVGDPVGEGLIADPNAPKYAPSIALQGEDDGQIVAVTTAPPAPAVPVEPVVVAEVAETAEPVSPAIQQTTADIAVATMETADTPTSAPDTPEIPAETTAEGFGALVIMPGRLSSGETYEEYRARLMNGLEGVGTSGSQPASGLARSSQPQQEDASDTIVISSVGVEQGSIGDGATYYSAASDNSRDTGFRRLMDDGELLTAASMKIATIYFSSGSGTLNRQDVNILRHVAALHQQNGGTIRVIGHASSRTRNMDEARHRLVNYRVSAKRANVIADTLVRLGLPKEEIVVVAASDSDPIFLEVMPTGEAGNRRAEIYIDS